jgi:hypothetical protein
VVIAINPGEFTFFAVRADTGPDPIAQRAYNLGQHVAKDL